MKCKFILLSSSLLISQVVSATSSWFLASELDCESLAHKSFASEREYAYDLAEYYQCLGFIAALVQADALPHTCIPEDMELDELRDLFAAGLTEQPDYADKPAQVAMQLIYGAHYPCQEPGR